MPGVRTGIFFWISLTRHKLFFWEKIIDTKKVVRNWGFHKLATRLTVIDSVYIRVCGFGRLWICGFLAVKYFWKKASS